jgi:hypothetical protein
LNIVAKDFFDAGDRELSETVQSTLIGYLGGYNNSETKSDLTDREALERMHATLEIILKDEHLTRAILDKLKSSQASWMKQRARLI